MPLPKLRGLDKFGVITDVDALDLPLGAWSFGLNVRFKNGRVNSAPVWRSVKAIGADPRFVYVSNKASNTSENYIGYLDGRVKAWSPLSETDVSPVGYVPSPLESAWTATTLAEVVYVNREDRVPWQMRPGDSQFSSLYAWNANWRAKILRAFGSALVAFNVTKSGTRYPTLVKTSDIVENPGDPPPTWDHTDPTNNATENPLTEMNGEIRDALALGDVMMIYSTSETWSMRQDGSDNVYAYRKLPFTGGAVNTNCVVEVNNRHYVFGKDDIWMHDGLSKTSIIEGRNKDFLFNSLNAKKADKFFVCHDPAKSEISFNYISGDEYVSFNGNGCNRAAVFNYVNDTWTFDDIPLTFHADYTVVASGSMTWDNVAQTWETIGGSWQDLEDGFKRALIYVGETSVPHGLTAKVYARDEYGDGSIVNYPVDTTATKGALIERLWIDLDDLDEDLRGYKHITKVYPLGRLEPDAEPWLFSFGVSDKTNEPPVFSDPQSYDADQFTELDFTAGGKFLHMRGVYNDFKKTSLSGFDFDLIVTGDR